jgi:hypothetical protein
MANPAPPAPPGPSIPPLSFLKPGIYNFDYFEGTQCAVYFGGIWIDEITSIGFQVSHSKVPLYGYSDSYFRAVSTGQVLVQGSFTINFKEAGYIWLVLNEYLKEKGMRTLLNPFTASDDIYRQNVERIAQWNSSNDPEFIKHRNEAIDSMAELFAKDDSGNFANKDSILARSQDALLGYPGGGRTSDSSQGLGFAENVFENFEDAIWSRDAANGLNTHGFKGTSEHGRDPANPVLNGFDLYIAYGDFIGDNRLNHTIRKISNIHILNWGQQVSQEGGAIQERYDFIAHSVV